MSGIGYVLTFRFAAADLWTPSKFGFGWNDAAGYPSHAPERCPAMLTRIGA